MLIFNFLISSALPTSISLANLLILPAKRAENFYTPRDVVRLMVRILKPQEGMRVYYPCAGSGGMLIHSKQYVEEHGGNPFNLGLYGQDNSGSVWSMCKMNMILHGVAGANIQNDDVLASPLSLC
jgi:type I restriction enzyme M protein